MTTQLLSHSSNSELFGDLIVNPLVADGHGFIPFMPPPDLMPRVMDGWNAFLKLPLETRIAWQCGNPEDYDDGYVLRKPDQPVCAGCTACVHDNKHFFHYRPGLLNLLDHKKVDYSDHLEWLKALHALYSFSHEVFYKVLLELDECDAGYCFAERFSSLVAEGRHVLRLLSYNGKMMPGQVLAKDHLDRNFGTIQVHQSKPGLVLNLLKGKVNYTPRSNQVLMFTGAKATLLTNKHLKAINHGVVVPEDYVSQDEDEPRQSIVFFGHIWPEKDC